MIRAITRTAKIIHIQKLLSAITLSTKVRVLFSLEDIGEELIWGDAGAVRLSTVTAGVGVAAGIVDLFSAIVKGKSSDHAPVPFSPVDACTTRTFQ